MDGMSYRGEFHSQSGSKRDFGEAMSQIFENWIWDYDMLSSLTKHYQSGEKLPKETFDNMVSASRAMEGLDHEETVTTSSQVVCHVCLKRRQGATPQ